MQAAASSIARSSSSRLQTSAITGVGVNPGSTARARAANNAIASARSERRHGPGLLARDAQPLTAGDEQTGSVRVTKHRDRSRGLG